VRLHVCHTFRAATLPPNVICNLLVVKSVYVGMYVAPCRNVLTLFLTSWLVPI